MSAQLLQQRATCITGLYYQQLFFCCNILFIISPLLDIELFRVKRQIRPNQLRWFLFILLTSTMSICCQSLKGLHHLLSYHYTLPLIVVLMYNAKTLRSEYYEQFILYLRDTNLICSPSFSPFGLLLISSFYPYILNVSLIAKGCTISTNSWPLS